MATRGWLQEMAAIKSQLTEKEGDSRDSMEEDG
jgi:hypothetical protein